MSLSIPFGHLDVTLTTKRLIMNILESGRLSSGKLVREFEEKYAEVVGVKHAVTASSGTNALAMALMMLYDYGAERGNAVLCPALTFPGTTNAVYQAGFVPEFVDIDRETLCIDAGKIGDVRRAEAIMPVSLMGKQPDWTTLRAIAEDQGPALIEDAAESHGGELDGVKSGAFGDIAGFSLYVAHILNTIEGGIATTNNEDCAAIMRSIRGDGRACTCKVCVANQGTGGCKKRWASGSDRRFQFDRIGMSCKMTELQAAQGLGCLEQYDEIIAKRHENLMAMIAIVDEFDCFDTIHEAKGEKIGPHALPIIVKEDAGFTRDDLAKFLVSKNVDTRNLFVNIPVTYGLAERGEYPNADYIEQFGLHVGVHQGLGPDHVSYLGEVLQEFVANPGR